LETQVDTLPLVISELLCASLAELITRQKPAELEIDNGTSLGVGLNADKAASGCRNGKLQRLPPCHHWDLTDVAHVSAPRVTAEACISSLLPRLHGKKN
jgi:hypothetical protein